MSERHREALAHLLYGLGGGGGFVLLTGEIGTGKTTLCRLFLAQIPSHCNVAYIFNPKLTATELLDSVCEEFRIERPAPGATVKCYVDRLNQFLLQSHAAGRNNVLIIDEAQNLSAEVLEQLRLLTNLETSERKLLQIILIGQPELREMVERPEMEQLAQRVIARYHLEALSAPETGQYIRHRLDVAGLERPLPFEARSIRRIHQLSEGVPRRINLLCDRALLGAFATSRATIDRSTVDKAAHEVFGARKPAPATARHAAAILGLGLAIGAGLYAAASRALLEEPGSIVDAQALAPVPSAAPASAAAAPVAVPVQPVALQPARLLSDPADAWRELAQMWKAEPGAGEPCQALARQQLQCFNRNLTLGLIRELGRPGIITLDAQHGAPRYALLTGLTRDTATLRADGTEQTVTLAALADRWQGEFATLWRTPPGYGERSGARGELVDWIAQRLATANGRPAPQAPSTLDASLRAQLRAFQVAQGLQADGQPGPMTFMQLNRAGGADEPRLQTGH
ncbi:ExeA family protein [Ramlibacter solisilvae]